MSDRENLLVFHRSIERKLVEIERIIGQLKLGTYRLTLVAYVSNRPEADIVLTKDEYPAEIIAAVRRMFANARHVIAPDGSVASKELES